MARKTRRRSRVARKSRKSRSSRKSRRSNRRSRRRSRRARRQHGGSKCGALKGAEIEQAPVVAQQPEEPAPEAQKGGKRKMNAFMVAKEKARKGGAASFNYKGKTYHKKTTKTGMVIYSSKK